LNFAKPPNPPSIHPFLWLCCSFGNTLSLDSHIRICAVDIRFACLGFLLRPFFSYRIISASWIWFLNFTEIPFPRRPRFIRYIYNIIYMYTYERSRIYPVPFGRNVWRMRKVYTTTRVKYKMYNVHTLERLPNTRSPCSRAHGSNTVWNTPIYKYIFLYVFFSLFFLFVRIPGWNLLHTSPYLNSTLLFCVCVNMHTYMYYEFSYYYNKNTIAVYSWKKNI